MFGITAGTLATGLSAAGSLAGGIAGAAGAGGAQQTKNDRLWNDYQRLASLPMMEQMKKIAMKDAKNVYKNPEAWAAYTGPRVADFTPDQQAAFDKARLIAGGDQWLTGAGNQVNRTLNGDYLNYQAPTNQYMGQQPSWGNAPSASNRFIGGQPDVTNTFIGKFGDYSNPYEGMQPGTFNKYEGSTTNVVNNPLLGLNNPYLNSAIDAAANDTIRNYQRAVTPATDAAFARAGAFGGSAWGDQTADNQKNLAETLSKQATNARMGDYTNQQGLMNSNAQFQTGVNQSDLARNAALAQNQIGMNQQNWQTNAGLNQNAANLNQNTWQSNLSALQAQKALESQNWQANLQANQAANSLANSQWATGAGLAQDAWKTNAQLAQNQLDNTLNNYQRERGYQQDAINSAMNLHNQGYTDANNLLQMGNQQQTQNQNLINAGMQQFYENQNSMKAPISWYQGVLSNSLGAFNPSGVTPQGASTNPYMGALGGAIGGYQLGNGLGGFLGVGGKNWASTRPVTSYNDINAPGLPTVVA